MNQSKLPAYAITVFTSALLLFLIQPLIAKQLLPSFGGAAGVWTACLMFFQIVLLLGYLYAHWSTTNMPCRAQGLIHALLLWLAAASSWIPMAKALPADAAQHPVRGVLTLLAGSVGVPYFVLSATSPLLQSWYALVERRDVPYRLFALSNLGSLLALLAYPLAIEPLLELRTQLLIWRLAYLVFAVFGTLVAMRAARSPAKATAVPHLDGSRNPSRKILWIALAACPSALLLAITNNLCQDIAPMPMLWIAPLAIYLITFVICFDHGPWFGRTAWRILLPAAILALISIQPLLDTSLYLAVPVYLGVLFIIAMFCHGKLVELKPDAAGLTSFYLCISLGGAIGGLFVGLVAPAIFSDFFESTVAISVALMLALRLLFGYRSPWFLAACGSTLLAVVWMWTDVASGQEFKGRNFYGTTAVRHVKGFRQLVHGRIAHGSELLSDLEPKAGHLPVPEPTTYYGRRSGGGLALQRGTGAQHVGAVGLGVGTVASYGNTGDVYQFYEINPLVEQLARSRFTYLASSRARVEVVLGDARLSLENAPVQSFDTLVLDAFSSDAIPIHLLTTEAFRSYFRHMKPDGLIAVHVSNQYLNLSPVVAAIAAGLGARAVRVSSPADPVRGTYPALWVLVAKDPRFLRELEAGKLATALNPGGLRAWTDQYSNILSVLWK